jgi:hypothetical protein
MPTHKQPFGLFALQPGKHGPSSPGFPTGNRLVQIGQLRDTDCAGLTIRFLPEHVKSSWKVVDDCIKKVKDAGKAYTLLAMSGTSSNPTLASYQKKYNDLTTEAAKRYGKDPDLAMWHVTGCSPSGTSEELHWPKISDAVLKCLKDRADFCRKAFPDVMLCYAISVKDRAKMDQLLNYINAKDDNFLIKHNALKAENIGASHNQYVAEAGRIGFNIGFEMVGSTKETKNGKPRTGSRDINDSIKQASAIAKLGKTDPKKIYVAIYPPDLGNMRADALK